MLNDLEENRTNPKRFWRCLNKNFPLDRKTNSQSCTRIRDEDGKILEGKELADFLGNYYATNGENLAKAFQTISPPFDLEEVRRDAKFVLRFVPWTVIEQLIREIDIGKSSGILGISTVLLKDAFMVHKDAFMVLSV